MRNLLLHELWTLLPPASFALWHCASECALGAIECVQLPAGFRMATRLVLPPLESIADTPARERDASDPWL
jgi:hypothetical protein